jgi:hypothetical protein
MGEQHLPFLTFEDGKKYIYGWEKRKRKTTNICIEVSIHIIDKKIDFFSRLNVVHDLSWQRDT